MSITLDGNTVQNFGGGPSPFSLTTANAGDLIYVLIASESNATSSGAAASAVSSPGLTFYRRGGAFSAAGGGSGVECWAAVAPAALTGAMISVVLNRSVDDGIMIGMGFAGPTGFDTNAAIPVGAPVGSGASSWPPVTFSTSKANDLLIGLSGSRGTKGAAASGWTQILTGGNGGGVNSMNAAVQTKAVTSTQSGATWAPSDNPGGNGGVFLDAITSDTLPTPPTFPTPIGVAIANCGGASGTVTLTTSAAGLIIIGVVHEDRGTDAQVSSVTASGLTFTRRGISQENTSGLNTAAELWEAPASGALTGETITVNFSASIDAGTIYAVGFAGAAGFDTNGSLPATATAVGGTPPGVTYSTTSSVGLAIALQGLAYGGGTFYPGAPPPGWTNIGLGNNGSHVNFIQSGFWVAPLNGAQTSAAFDLLSDSSTNHAIIVDALAVGPSSVDGDYAPGNVTVSNPTWTAGSPAAGDYAPGNVTVATGNWSAASYSEGPYAPGNVTIATGDWTAFSPGVGSYAPGSVTVSDPAWVGPVDGQVAELDVAVVAAPLTNARAAEIDVAVLGLPPSVARTAEIDVAVLAPPTGTTHGGVAEVDVACLVYVGPPATRRCQVWKITRKDGTVFAFTSLDRDIEWLGTTYLTCNSLTASAAESNSELRSVGNVDLKGILSDDAITSADVYAGLFDDAFVEVWVIPWDGQPDDQSPFRIAAGWTGKFTREEYAFETEVLGPGARLQQTALVDFVTPGCRWDFGSPQCTKDANALKAAGITVTGQVQRTIVQFTEAMPEGTQYWNNGTVNWLTGRNAGVSCAVATVDFAAGALSLWDLAPYPPQAGDTFDLLPGCAKTKPVCVTAYANYVNFGGFTDVPGPDSLQSNADSLFTGNG